MSKHKTIEGKPNLALIPYAALEAIAAGRMYGLEKYGSAKEWYGTCQTDDFVTAAMRHIGKYNDAVTLGNRSVYDEESGVHHLDHAITSLAIAVSLRDQDDEVDFDIEDTEDEQLKLWLKGIHESHL